MGAAEVRARYETAVAEVRLKGRDGIVPMTHWVTEVFRRTASGWMLVHRHADSTVERYARLTTPL